jgi:acyl carrier protein
MIKDKLRRLLEEKFPGTDLDADFAIQMNSMRVVELLVALEKEFGIRIDALEVDESNFANLEAMARFVEEKMARRS